MIPCLRTKGARLNWKKKIRVKSNLLYGGHQHLRQFARLGALLDGTQNKEYIQRTILTFILTTIGKEIFK